MQDDNSIVWYESDLASWPQPTFPSSKSLVKDELQTTIRHLEISLAPGKKKVFTSRVGCHCWISDILAQKFMFINENYLLNFFCASQTVLWDNKFGPRERKEWQKIRLSWVVLLFVQFICILIWLKLQSAWRMSEVCQRWWPSRCKHRHPVTGTRMHWTLGCVHNPTGIAIKFPVQLLNEI